jgi:hypothetical protein
MGAPVGIEMQTDPALKQAGRQASRQAGKHLWE